MHAYFISVAYNSTFSAWHGPFIDPCPFFLSHDRFPILDSALQLIGWINLSVLSICNSFFGCIHSFLLFNAILTCLDVIFILFIFYFIFISLIFIISIGWNYSSPYGYTNFCYLGTEALVDHIYVGQSLPTDICRLMVICTKITKNCSSGNGHLDVVRT